MPVSVVNGTYGSNIISTTSVALPQMSMTWSSFTAWSSRSSFDSKSSRLQLFTSGLVARCLSCSANSLCYHGSFFSKVTLRFRFSLKLRGKWPHWTQYYTTTISQLKCESEAYTVLVRSKTTGYPTTKPHYKNLTSSNHHRDILGAKLSPTFHMAHSFESHTAFWDQFFTAPS